MKKLLILILAIAMIFVFAACDAADVVVGSEGNLKNAVSGDPSADREGYPAPSGYSGSGSGGYSGSGSGAGAGSIADSDTGAGSGTGSDAGAIPGIAVADYIADAFTPGGFYEKLIGLKERVLDGDAIYAEDNEQVGAGQITAKAWDDNEHFDEWRALFVAGTENEPEGGKFAVYQGGDWAYDTSTRVKVMVRSDEEPVFGAEVEYIDSAQRRWVSRTDVSGVAYLFPEESTGDIKVTSGESVETVSFSDNAQDLTVELRSAQAQVNVIKIMFVIDATGSMGDEMRYISAELRDVVHRVATESEEVRIDLALLFYRDDGDSEKFAYHDFLTVTDDEGLQAQLSVLSKQYATGGGDLPEAMDEAVLMGAEKDWGEENATRLMFLVLDAPSHDTAKNLERCIAAVKAAAAKGIRICPVLCSGADTFCEYQTRMGALLTGGTMIFVTDDSGIGGSHLDPDLPDATVEKLNDLLVRLIVGYHTGDFGTPVAWNADKEGEETDEIVAPEIIEEDSAKE